MLEGICFGSHLASFVPRRTNLHNLLRTKCLVSAYVPALESRYLTILSVTGVDMTILSQLDLGFLDCKRNKSAVAETNYAYHRNWVSIIFIICPQEN
jgi:hypothetical protein